MNRIVYFADKAVAFTDQTPPAGWHAVTLGAESPSRSKVQNFLDTHNRVAILVADPEAAFAAFAADFVLVEAAGGVVVNPKGEWLMIHRNGRWDLPKGHIEFGEAATVCAAREVEEETGVRADVVRPLCETLHAYFFSHTARWELKRTYWYALRTDAPDSLAPQTEEGIDAVEWCAVEEIDAYLADAFPTIRCVAEAMLRK